MRKGRSHLRLIAVVGGLYAQDLSCRALSIGLGYRMAADRHDDVDLRCPNLERRWKVRISFVKKLFSGPAQYPNKCGAFVDRFGINSRRMQICSSGKIRGENVARAWGIIRE